MTAGQIPEICPVFYYVPDKAQALSEVFAKSQITAFLEAVPDKAESEPSPVGQALGEESPGCIAEAARVRPPQRKITPPHSAVV